MERPRPESKRAGPATTTTPPTRTTTTATRESFGNIFSGFNDGILSDSFNIESELARRLMRQDDQWGNVVTVQSELQILSPRYDRGEGGVRERQERRWQGRDDCNASKGASANGSEETLCTLRDNIDNPERAEIHNPAMGSVGGGSAHR
ncbi:11S globulin seed storage protein 1-like [Syzygium oleosum]|uniref:11S globulin seed storage protein 1-like n=1 Tax=Syzygium oleosum TaxID=219896 RepID=UPI0024BA0AF6|nr:11S globulin seed storage protein 1-like [Syzygium oleosum]